MSNLQKVGEKIVRKAGLMAKEILLHSKVHHYKKFREPVTEGDIRVEEFLISSLKEVFPDHGFDSEEKGKENAEAEYVWVLDPIDGTKYYAKDVPLYSVSLALERNNQLVLGIVYSPEFDRMYCASIGGGTTMNGREIYCSKEEHLNKASICLEIPSRSSSSQEQQWAMKKMSMLVESAYRVRIIGVGALGLCFCAMGGFDAYVNLGSMWKYCDIAAGQVIVQEAAGEFLYAGEKKRQIVAGPKALCDEIREILKI